MEGIGRSDMGKGIREAIVVPDDQLDTPLISIGKMDKAGYEITMGSGRAVIRKDDKVIATAPLQDNLYQIDMHHLAKKMDEHEAREQAYSSRSAIPLNTIQELHERFGHRSHELIEKYARQKLLPGVEVPKLTTEERKSIPLCEHCVLTKSTLRHAKRVSHVVTVGIGEEISTDIKGPMRVPGMDGEVYYQGVIDRGSRRIYPFFLKTKSEAWDTMTQLISDPKFVNLKRWHSDGAGELSGKKISDHLASRGVYCTFAPPYSAWANGIIERSNRTIWDMHMPMLHASGLPDALWPYSVRYACFLHSLIPTQTCKGFMSPFECDMGYKFDYKKVRKFGCIAYAHIAKELRRKGDEKATKCRFLGIRDPEIEGTGYVLLRLDTGEIILSDTVQFDETVPMIPVSQTGVQLPDTERARQDVLPYSNNVADYNWLIGMCYRDPDIMYITNRIAVEKGSIVAYRSAILDGKKTLEEVYPMHIGNVVQLVEFYMKNTGGVTTEVTKTVPGSGVSSELRSMTAERMTGGTLERVMPHHIVAPSRAEQTRPRGSGAGNQTSRRDSSSGVGGGGSPWERMATTPTVPGELSRAVEINSADRGAAATPKLDSSSGAHRQRQDGRSASGQATAAQGSHAQAPVLREQRDRRTRVPINIGQLGGNIERSFSVVVDSVEYAFNITDPHVDVSSAVNTFRQVMANYDKPHWIAAMRKELESIVLVNRAVKVPDRAPPAGTKRLKTRWIFKKKFLNDGRWKYKARLVIKGFAQIRGVDYTETFAPTARMETLRIFLTICASNDYHVRQLDVTTAYLNAKLDEELYIDPIEGMLEEGNPLGLDPREYDLSNLKSKGVYRLLKSIYGLKQAGHNWNKMINKIILDMGFKRSFSDPCLYYRRHLTTDRIELILLYVDDLLIGAYEDDTIEDIVHLLTLDVKLNDLGTIDTYLSIKIVRDADDRTFTLTQTVYIDELKDKYIVGEFPSVKYPLTELHMLKIDDPEDSEEDKLYVLHFPVKELLGGLIYIAVCTRPDIMFAVSYLSRYASKPVRKTCDGLNNVLMYLINTKRRGLVLGGRGPMRLTVFCDTDYANDIETRRSMECFLVYLCGGLIAWYAKLQSRVSLSVSEAEFCCLTPACKSVLTTRNLMSELGLKAKYGTNMYCDNTAAQTMSQNPFSVHRTRHIGAQYFLVRNQDLILCLLFRTYRDMHPSLCARPAMD
jgi:hypothetical protein